MHLKDLLGSFIRVGYFILVPGFYLAFTAKKALQWINLIKSKGTWFQLWSWYIDTLISWWTLTFVTGITCTGSSLFWSCDWSCDVSQQLTRRFESSHHKRFHTDPPSLGSWQTTKRHMNDSYQMTFKWCSYTFENIFVSKLIQYGLKSIKINSEKWCAMVRIRLVLHV